MKWLWLAGMVLFADQISKYYAAELLVLYQPLPLLPSLNLTLAHNTGAAFSFLSSASGWQRWFFIGLALMVSAFIITWLRRLEPTQRLLGCSLALIMGGSLGNVCDRLVHGYVIDFIDVYYQQWHWPVFNIADSAISVGAVLLILETLLSRRGSQSQQDE